MSWDEISYIMSSKTRHAIILKLDTPKTPTILANNLKINIANVSRALSELQSKKIVICMTPTQRVGRIYGLTKKGKKVTSSIKAMEY